jgi:ADP-heptose:LPS heptosyltransferase
MATALDVATVTLHGPTNPANWSARLPTTIPLRRNEGCPVCARRGGANRPGHDCMTRLGVDEVEGAVAALLEARHAGAAGAAGAAGGGAREARA